MIQRGDTLFSLALATGSSVNELILANCLLDSHIIAGRPLHVPRLPSFPTPIPPVIIPSDTPAPPKNSPTDFKPYGMSCDGPAYVSLSVAIYDLEGVASVDVGLYTDKDEFIAVIAMNPDGDVYYGSDSLPEAFTVFDIGYYKFNAVDKFDNVTVSLPYQDRSNNCLGLQ
jgi:LysM domain